MAGWLKLHRTITESAVFDDAEVLKVWIYLLCDATVFEHQRVVSGTVLTVKAGQVLTGRKKLSLALNMSESKVYRALNILQKLGNITIEANNRFSLITVDKWAFYQDESEKVNSQTTAERQPSNSPSTTGQHQNNSRATHNKNGNNGNNGNNGKKGENMPARGAYQNVFLTDEEFTSLKSLYPNDCEAKIERLSKYMADSGKEYCSHYNTLVEWIKKDGVTLQGSFEAEEFFEAAVKKGREKMNDSGS